VVQNKYIPTEFREALNAMNKIQQLHQALSLMLTSSHTGIERVLQQLSFRCKKHHQVDLGLIRAISRNSPFKHLPAFHSALWPFFGPDSVRVLQWRWNEKYTRHLAKVFGEPPK